MNNKMNHISSLWVQSHKISNEYKKYILEMSEDDINRFFTDDKMTFGTAGIRATMGPGTNQINTFTYQQMAEGFARWLLLTKENPSVVVAHDNRKNADFYSKVVAKVLTSFGIKVIFFPNNELKATPITSYAIRMAKADGGIIITASHNPKNYLGFKVYNSFGAQILPDDANKIVALMPENNTILDNEYAINNDLIEYFDNSITESYFKDATKCLIHTDVDKEKIFPIIFTAHHGTASHDLPNFLNTLGYKNVIKVEQQCVPDSNFTYSPISNPEDKRSFELSLKYAEKNKSDIMLAVDPDSDRLAVAVLHDNKWRYLTGNEMGIIFTHYVLKNKTFTKEPFIISTYVSTYYIDKIAKEFDAKVFRTATGFKWVGNVLEQYYQQQDFVVGFEEAIGSLNSDIGRDKDGFQAAALALEVYDECRMHDKTLIDYLNDIFNEYGAWAGETVSYLIEAPNWKETMSARMDYFAKMKNKNILNLKILENKYNKKADALEWILEDGMWIKFRMSGTEPKFKVYFDLYGETVEEANRLLDALKLEIDIILRS